jgi:hypothetical protein
MRAAWGALLVVTLSACSATSAQPPASGGASPQPTASRASAAASPTASAAQQHYARAVLADRPSGLWTLADTTGLRPGDAVEDASPAVADGRLVEGTMLPTTGPGRETAARFVGTGRIVTPVGPLLRPGRPFTVELFFRADDCSRHWTQVAGTATYDRNGREGVNVLHYPRSSSTPCHLAVEFWRHDRYVGGCGPNAVARPGVWLHFAVTYDGRAVRCFLGGALIGTSTVPDFGFGPTVPFGIGGAGDGYAGTLDSGSLADVAVYGRALSAQVLRRHVAAMSP